MSRTTTGFPARPRAETGTGTAGLRTARGAALPPLLTVLLLALAALFAAAGCGRRVTLAEQGLRDGVLHRGIGPEIEDLDPHFASTAGDRNVLSALYEGLVSEDPADGSPVPGTARSWTVGGGGRVFTFSLREDARWSDGSPLTAGDFVASYRRALSPRLGARGAAALHVLRGARAYHRGETADFSGVGARALDERTLELTLEAPNAAFLAMLTLPAWWPVHTPTLEAHGALEQRQGAWARPGTLVGNGPFVLTEWSVNHRIVVRKSPHYWDAAAVRLNGICFYPMSVDTEERAFRAGQLHVTDALPAGRADFHRRASPSPLRADPLLGTYFYRLNTRLPQLADARVRRALSLALDRRALIDTVLRGGQQAAVGFTPAGIPGYPVPERAGFDPEQARRLLAEAGHEGGRGLPALELLFNSSDTHRLVAEAVQEMWRRHLGVEAKLVNMENTSILAARRAGEFQVLRSSWVADYADAGNFLGIWRSDSPDNHTGWADPAFDALLLEAESQTDPVLRAKQLARAEERLLEGAPFLGLYHYTHLYLLHPAVRGWHPNALDQHPYKHVWLEP